MPYTPPASRSPTSSISRSQPVSPTTSVHTHSPPVSPGPRFNLPRSRSQKLRDDIPPPSLADGPRRAGLEARAAALVAEKQAKADGKGTLSIDTKGTAQMSLGADAAASNTQQPARHESSDEENYAELERAVRESLQLNGAGEPENGLASQPDAQASSSDSTDSETSSTQSSKLSHSARKITHSRSSTEPVIVYNPETPQAELPPRPASTDGSEDDGDDEDWGLKPPLIRKKSGELVKPALRPHMQLRRKHSSMPGTPTYGGKKGVHFSDNITQVRHFLQVDRPLAVSAGGSPVESYEDEMEFPFDRPKASSPGGFEVRLNNFPRDSLERLSQPLRVDRIALSGDQKALLGDVVVANLSFHKTVTARFTTDAWKTTSEVCAAYNGDARKKPKDPGFDLFSFSINLTDQANLDKKTMLMCIRYNVGGQEFWDNNNSQNYRIEFVKKQQQQHAAQNFSRSQVPQGIPRSRNSSAQHKLRTKPSEDDFGNAYDPSPFRFKQPSKGTLSDTPIARKSQASGQQFGNRYDFGASLTAALNHAQTQLGDRSGIKTLPNSQSQPRKEPVQKADPPKPAPVRVARQVDTSGTESPRSDGLLSNKPSVDSRAYQEFVSKFCFFGSGKPSSPGSQPPPRPAASKSHPPNSDGSHDEVQATANKPQAEASGSSWHNAVPQPSTGFNTSRSEARPDQFYGQHHNPGSPPSSSDSAKDIDARAAAVSGYPLGPKAHSDFFSAGSVTPPAIRG